MCGVCVFSQSVYRTCTQEEMYASGRALRGGRAGLTKLSGEQSPSFKACDGT